MWGLSSSKKEPEPPKQLEPWPALLAQFEKAKESNWSIESLNALGNSMIAVMSPTGFVAVTFATGWLAGSYFYRGRRRYFKPFPNGDWITPDWFVAKAKDRRVIKGRVVFVGDADNFRIYHTPLLDWRTTPSFKKGTLLPNTIHIRMSGVDAPEKGQNYHLESKAWLKGQVLGKTVYCELVGRERWGRILAMPYIKPPLVPGFLAKRLGKSVSLEMVRAGWGTIYEQAGADYGRIGGEKFQYLENEAKNARRGIWQDGPDIERPAVFKQKIRAGSPQPEEDELVADDIARRGSPVRKILTSFTSKFRGKAL